MYTIIAGAGKVGWNLARELLERGDEVLVVLDPGIEEDITAQFVGPNGAG